MVRLSKPIAGVLLIVISVGTIVYWEGWGRDKVTLENVLVPIYDIYEGTKIQRSDFEEVGVLKENVIKKSITSANFKDIEGLEAEGILIKGNQVSRKTLREKTNINEKGLRIFPIKGEWIEGRSSSLRAGDMVEIYDWNCQNSLGVFRTAFVKDANDNEVISTDGSGSVGKGGKSQNVPNEKALKRKSSTGIINHIEILCGPEEYKVITDYVEAMKAAMGGEADTEGGLALKGLMLVQKNQE